MSGTGSGVGGWVFFYNPTPCDFKNHSKDFGFEVGAIQALGSWAGYRGTSLIRNGALLGPYSRTVPRALWKPKGWGLFLMGEVPL